MHSEVVRRRSGTVRRERHSHLTDAYVGEEGANEPMRGKALDTDVDLGSDHTQIAGTDTAAPTVPSIRDTQRGHRYDH
jgi:hypothetical protein